MDCTASMEPWIHQAKTRMAELTDQVRKDHPSANILVSFVGYRDFGDVEPAVVYPFQSGESLMHNIRNVKAEGGDDIAEDVVLGLQCALYQDWSDADIKMLFHIADAPAHGTAFHAVGFSDRYPRGHPQGLDPRDFVEKMSFLDIHYTFVRIDDSTDTMVEQFHNCYTKGGSFNVVDLYERREDPTTLSTTLSATITQCITQHYTSSLAQ
jgi:hypothetical protein